MAEPRADAAQIAGTVEWLEDEHRQLQARVGRLEQELEQLATANRDRAIRQRADAADVETLRQQLTRVPGIEDTMRLLQGDLANLRSLVAQQAAELERAERAHGIELERMRLSLAEVNQRLAVVSDEFRPLPMRIQALGDHGRRVQDQVTQVRQIGDDILGRQAALQSKIDLAVEQTHRVEQALSALINEFAPLRREDEVLASRIQLAIDHVRQVEAKMADVLAEEQARRELTERVEILRAERQRMLHQLADLEHASAGLIERTEELFRLLRQESDHRKLLAERFRSIEGQMLDARQSTTEAIIQIWQAAEVRQRQNIALLQDQAKALRETLQRLTRPEIADEA